MTTMPLTPKEARWKFKRAVRIIIMQITLNKSTAEVDESEGKLSYINTIDGEELTFDKKYFKAKRQTRITQEVRNILSIEVEDRTSEQLRLALRGLHCVKSFAEYPSHLQEKLTKVAYLYNISQKKVIIRQGHHAEMFYFVVTGTVDESVSERESDSDEDPVTRVVNVFKRGDCFGETEILHNIPRQSTFTASTPCELLAIESEDFFDLFVTTGEQKEEFEHFKFLRTLPFIKGWPVCKLYEHPQMCMSHFFKRGSVLIKDSNNSDWLYIVKSGSGQVIKELKEAKPAVHSERRISAKPEMYAYRKIGPKIDSHRRRSSTCTSLPPPDISSNRFKPRTYITDMSSDNQSDISSKDDIPLSNEDKTVFVQVDVLLPKDIFGLPMLCNENGIMDIVQPSLSLVSRGVECIMLNKRFFMEHANQAVKQHLKEIVRPYPMQETLQQHLQVHTDWQHYKTKTLSGVLQKGRRKSATP